MPSRLLVVGALSAASIALVAAPAAAAPIADGTIFTPSWYGGQLYTASPTDGALTAIGSPSGVNLISGLDFDGDTGIGYAVTYATQSSDPDVPLGDSELYTVDPVTGAMASVGVITRNGEPVDNCLDLDYTAGVILIACDWDATESWIGSVDPATAAVTLVVPSIDRTQGIARQGDTLIAFGFEGVVNSVDLADGTITDLGIVATSGLYPAGADFAGDGTLYVSSHASMEPFNLYTFDVASLTGELVGPMGLDGADVGAGEDVSVTSLTPTDAPALAATGLDAAPLAAGALLAALGAALLAAARYRSRAVRM